ncbi:hypothetical protein PR048_013581 [Dryococelus australis]|uniref:Uncharacterized protein n=1 Tax=Dryococelus australis TaxID=614101 RepID=A0ABQ9HSQ7_9NEOP|nr:hypothetical protein PR048_013581 [Dryococelus australis]
MKQWQVKLRINLATQQRILICMDRGQWSERTLAVSGYLPQTEQESVYSCPVFTYSAKISFQSCRTQFFGKGSLTHGSGFHAQCY